MKEHDAKWLAAGEVNAEAMISGQIKNINSEKQRFYYHRYLFIQELKIQTDTQLIKAKKISPLKKETKPDVFVKGDSIHLYGSWQGSYFLISHYENINSNE
ncbi:hypothetical protein [Bacillus sp. MRMR6]|uniref:hypothetical protein n=1 Tax=Bacillus sp. MRMR6 TaxID=1928617 RepID=UPI0020C9E904|nr:hypothetical protein [Bacillus sp. MRMR6]